MMRPQGLIAEIAALSVATLVVALIANAFNDSSGLKLGRDYFPAEAAPAQRSTPLEHQFQSLTLEDAKLYQEYAAGEQGVVFLDARSEKLYRAGHIPGSHLCHHYQQDRYIPDLLPMMREADIVVIYCAGGDCEDSIQLATDLVYTHGLPLELMAIYEGGYDEWTQAELPVREGATP